MTIAILLADDHATVRAGLHALLSAEPEFKVVGEAADGRHAIELAGRLRPQVVVMDIGMPGLNGVEATRQLTVGNPDIKVVALSAYGDKQFVLAMLDAGAAAYVLKSSLANELIAAIRTVVQNQKYLSPGVAAIVVDGYVDRHRLFPPEPTAQAVLGAREREVLQLVAEGRTSKEIAALLHISSKTVEVHRENLMKKLNLHTVAELTKYAIREGLTSL